MGHGILERLQHGNSSWGLVTEGDKSLDFCKANYFVLKYKLINELMREYPLIFAGAA